MNEHGKSDKPILPEKPSNKVGTTAAEGAEGRGLAKARCSSALCIWCELR
jgi:hypothetical protein